MKKVLKAAGAVVLGALALLFVKNYVDSVRPWLREDYYRDFRSDAPLERHYAGLGAYRVSALTERAADKAVGTLRLWYPAEGTQAFPLVVVVNASNTAARNYEPFFARLASWGFVVAGNDDRQTGTGRTASLTLDAVLALADTPTSPLYGRIDRDNIGIVGYSQGGAGALRAATAYENSGAYKAIFTASAPYALLAHNMGWGYDLSRLTIPYLMTAGTGVSDDSGHYGADEFAGVAPLFSLEENAAAMPADVPRVRARAAGAEHSDMLHRTDGYLTAWLLYHLRGDTQAAQVFTGDAPELLHNPNWQDVAVSP